MYFILAMVAIFTIVTPVGRRLHRLRLVKQQSELIAKRSARAEELLATYQTDSEARKMLYESFRSAWMADGLSEELRARLKAAYMQIVVDDNRAKYLPGLNKRHEECLAEPNLVGKTNLLLQIIALLDQCQPEVQAEFETTTGLNKASAKEQVKQLIKQRIEELAAALDERFDPDAFRELNLLRYDCMDEYRTCGRKFAKYTPSSNWMPTNWNELVAQYVANPHLYDFAGMRDMPVGEARRLAAEALRDQNLTQAKIVLAWCNFSSKIRVEVGDVLSADLAKFVAAEAKRSSEQQG